MQSCVFCVLAHNQNGPIFDCVAGERSRARARWRRLVDCYFILLLFIIFFLFCFRSVGILRVRAREWWTQVNTQLKHIECYVFWFFFSQLDWGAENRWEQLARMIEADWHRCAASVCVCIGLSVGAVGTCVSARRTSATVLFQKFCFSVVQN